MLFRSRVNDGVAKWLCRFDLNGYRAEHLQHHRYVQQALDPDLGLSAKFPVTRDSLRRKFIRDLSGQTFYKQRFGPLIEGLRAQPAGAPITPQLQAELRRQPMFYLGNAGGAVLFAAFGLGWAWALMWLLPMATWLLLVARIRNIAEHALLAQDEPDPLHHARTTRTNLLERILIAPYWVNYHSEHHLFTQIPCWRLPRAHRMLRAKGVTPRLEIQPGYAAMLRLAAAA